MEGKWHGFNEVPKKDQNAWHRLIDTKQRTKAWYESEDKTQSDPVLDAICAVTFRSNPNDANLTPMTKARRTSREGSRVSTILAWMRSIPSALCLPQIQA